MSMLCVNESLDQLAISNSVCLYGVVLRREDGHVTRRALELKVKDCHSRKWRLKMTTMEPEDDNDGD